MARIVNEAIELVEAGPGGPRRFRWRGRTYVVADVLEVWREMGAWWDEDPPTERTVYRIVLEGGAVAELEHRRPDGTWCLYKLYD